ncbi:DNA-binding protein Alba [Candidatus Micrarchaeota archaeon CG1_02_60_51]|nr:MAG: DNA-binding protein Alba [Candidatus Micrarchaeota archaeon CG1_02_60_51]
MVYVLAVVTQFNAGEKQVQVKARGRAISRAVDVTQIVKHRFFNTLEVTGFKVETETLANEDGTTSRVSSVTMTLAK